MQVGEKEFILQCHTAPGKDLLYCYTYKMFLWYTVEPLYCGHLGDLVKCPIERCPRFRGKFLLEKHIYNVGLRKVSLIQRCPYWYTLQTA